MRPCIWLEALGLPGLYILQWLKGGGRQETQFSTLTGEIHCKPSLVLASNLKPTHHYPPTAILPVHSVVPEHAVSVWLTKRTVVASNDVGDLAGLPMNFEGWHWHPVRHCAAIIANLHIRTLKHIVPNTWINKDKHTMIITYIQIYICIPVQYIDPNMFLPATVMAPVSKRLFRLCLCNLCLQLLLLRSQCLRLKATWLVDVSVHGSSIAASYTLSVCIELYRNVVQKPNASTKNS